MDGGVGVGLDLELKICVSHIAVYCDFLVFKVNPATFIVVVAVMSPPLLHCATLPLLKGPSREVSCRRVSSLSRCACGVCWRNLPKPGRRSVIGMTILVMATAG